MQKNIKKYTGVLLVSSVVLGGIASAAITPFPEAASLPNAVSGQVIKTTDINTLLTAVKSLNERTPNHEQITVTTDGKVGIGTTAPASNFDVRDGSIITSRNVIKRNLNIDGLCSSGWTLVNGYCEAYNSGTSVLALGASANANNFGANIVAVGTNALAENKGNTSLTAIGYASGRYNTATSSTFSGDISGYYNTGAFSSIYGVSAGQFNTGEHLVAIGVNAGRYNSASINTIVGGEAFNSWVNGQEFIITAADPVNETVTIPNHGFIGITGDRLALKILDSHIPGILDGNIIMFDIIDENTLKAINTNITATATGTSKAYPNAHAFSNVTALGYNAEPTDNDQVVLGDTNIKQVKTSGSIKIGGGLGTCDATHAGEIRYTTAGFQGCHNAAWVNLH